MGFYIYILYKPNGTPFYVGKGTRIDRMKFHEWLAKRTNDKSYKSNIIRKILKSGAKVKYQVFGVFETEEEAFKCERALICKLGRIDLGTGTLVNLTDGGEGCSGFKLSEASLNKKRISMIGKNKGINHWNYGNTLSKEYKEKISRSLMGRNRGKNNPMYGINGSKSPNSKKYVITPTSKHEFVIDCLRVFCKDNNLSESAMSMCATKKRFTHKGFRCRYYDSNTDERLTVWRGVE